MLSNVKGLRSSQSRVHCVVAVTTAMLNLGRLHVVTRCFGLFGKKNTIHTTMNFIVPE